MSCVLRSVLRFDNHSRLQMSAMQTDEELAHNRHRSLLELVMGGFSFKALKGLARIPAQQEADLNALSGMDTHASRSVSQL